MIKRKKVLQNYQQTIYKAMYKNDIVVLNIGKVVNASSKFGVKTFQTDFSA